MMPKFTNRRGFKYGKLLVLKRSKNDRHGNARWVCICDCGKRKIVNSTYLQKGETKSCGCSNSHLRPFEALYKKLKREANHEVLLSYEAFLEFTKQKQCHYCGADVLWKKYGPNAGWKLDRKDNSLGYTKENCAACCKRCNLGKNYLFTYEEWKAVGALIRSWGS